MRPGASWCLVRGEPTLPTIVTTTHPTHVDCDEFNIWPHVAPILQARLPLQNVEWKSPQQLQQQQQSTNLLMAAAPILAASTLASSPVTGGGMGGGGGGTQNRTSDIRVLPRLHVDLQKFAPDVWSTRFHPLLQLRHVPYMHLYWIQCDVRTYQHWGRGRWRVSWWLTTDCSAGSRSLQTSHQEANS